MREIDERIVEMRFNNSQFEDGVQTSIKSVDNLKKSLQLEESAKSLSNLERVGRNFSLEGISRGVESLVNKFSTLGIIGITTLQNITNSAINAGKRLISSLTIDPIKTGLNEYETKIGAIQTILTNTADKGTTLKDVTNSLDELNTYADKTIYNFAEMAKNIGTFTAAGIDLKTSTMSIKGIANLAAGSGSTTQQASTAMYQLSQAIAAGSVKLMDWNSVVNAGMGGQLFQKALKGTAKELGIVVDESVPFRESLKDGWITTEVLTKTLSKLAEDESLLKAATQVKTFTQLLDTMKESVQSGWAQSWEQIIGDKDQASTLLTKVNDIFGNIVGSAAEARNAMLAFWNANGGRDAIIEAIFNAFKGLSEIIAPITEAFKEIFPPMTGLRLIEISEKIRDLTRNFKIGEETANNIKRTFKGLFAILDIGRMAFVAIASAVGSLIGYLLPVGGGLLSVTGSFGEYVVSLREALKQTDAFNVIFQKVGDFLRPVADKVKAAFSVIVGVFKSFGNVDLSGLDNFSNQVQTRLEPFAALGRVIGKVFSVMMGIVKSAAPIFIKLADLIGQGLGKLSVAVSNSVRTLEFDKLFDMINGGLFAAILLGLKKFIGSLTGITDSAGGFLGGIKGILDGVKDSLAAYQTQLKAGTLLKIAAAIGILAMSLAVIAMIDSEKLTVALTAITVLFAELVGSMVIFEKVMGGTGFKGMIKVTTMMLGLSVAILILSVAMTQLSKLDWEGIAKGLLAVAGLSAIMITSAQAMSKHSVKIMGSALGMIAFAVALTILVGVVKKLGDLDVGALTKGLVSVGVLMTELAIFAKITDTNKMGIGKGIGLMALAVAMATMASAVQKMGNIDIGNLVKGLGAMTLILTELAIFVNLTGDAKKVAATGFGLILLGTAMLIFSKAIANMGAIPIENIGKGLAAMAGALTIITLALKFMPKNIVFTSMGLTGIAIALVILSKALSTMGGMTWGEIAKGLVVLAGALTIIAIAVNLMAMTLPGAAALLVVAAALAILTPVLATLGGMSLAAIGKGLLALCGVFLVLGLAGLALSPVVLTLLGVGAAIALLGAGTMLAGSGLLLFSAGLSALAVSGAAGAAALVVLVSGIIGLIPTILQALGEGLVLLIVIIGQQAPTIVAAIVKLAIAIIDGLLVLIPKIVEAGYKLLTSLVNTVLKYAPKLVDAGMKVISAILKGISGNIKDVVSIAIEIITNFIDGVASMIPKVIDSAFNLVISFINGLANSIEKNTEPMIAAIKKLVLAVVDAAIKAFLGSINLFVDIGASIIQGLIKGFKDTIKNVGKAVGNIANTVLSTFKGILGIHSPSKEFSDCGASIIYGLRNGIDKNASKAVDATKNLANKVVDAGKKALGVGITSKQTYGLGVVNELRAQLDASQTIQKEQTKITNQSVKTENNATKKKASSVKDLTTVRKEAFDKEMDLIEDKKYYNRLSLEQELESLERLQNKYRQDSEERKKIDREVYRVKQELIKAAEEAQKKSFDDSNTWIDNEKYYNRLSLNDELAGWERVQKRFDKGSDERKKADREVYRVKQELIAKQKEIDDDYYQHTKDTNEKIKADIPILNNEYDQALKSREDSLYSSYGLFDKVGKQEPVSGGELFNNLKDQLKEMETWEQTLKELAAKGVDEGLIKELTAMGPKASNQVQALNKLTAGDLDTYVIMWGKKHKEARTQAVDELEGMRIDTDKKISELNTQAETDLEGYKQTWLTKTKELTGGVSTELSKMSSDVAEAIGDMKTDVVKEATILTKDVKKTFDSTDWKGVGSNIVLGIISGLKAKSKDLAIESAKNARLALQSAEDALGIKSPSKEFEKVGMFATQGFVGGIKKYLGLVIDAGSDVGNTAMDSLKRTISNVSDLLSGNSDMIPTISPVIDMTNVEKGLSSTFNKARSINVSEIQNRTSGISTSMERRRGGSIADGINATTTNTDQSSIVIHNHYSVRNDNDIRKISIEQNNLVNRYARAKGAPAW